MQQQLQQQRILREMERNRCVTNTLASVSVCFVGCWFPWNAVNILIDLRPDLLPGHVTYALMATCHIVAMLSALLNPLLYGYSNTNIRRELRLRSASSAAPAAAAGAAA